MEREILKKLENISALADNIGGCAVEKTKDKPFKSIIF
jgi:hypothetical protein